MKLLRQVTGCHTSTRICTSWTTGKIPAAKIYVFKSISYSCTFVRYLITCGLSIALMSKCFVFRIDCKQIFDFENNIFWSYVCLQLSPMSIFSHDIDAAFDWFEIETSSIHCTYYSAITTKPSYRALDS